MMEALQNSYYSYYDTFFPPMDVPKSLREAKSNLTSAQVAEWEGRLTPIAIQQEILPYIVGREEDKAIQCTLKMHAIIEASSGNSKELLDFTIRLPQKSLACGRSLKHLSNLRNLDKLSYLIRFFSNPAFPGKL